MSGQNGHILGRPRGVTTLADAIADARKAERQAIEVNGGQAARRQEDLDKAFDHQIGHTILNMLRSAGWSRCHGRPAPRIRLERGRGLRIEVAHLHAIQAGGTVVPACWVVMASIGGRWLTRECSDGWLRHHVLVLAGKIEDELQRIRGIEEGA